MSCFGSSSVAFIRSPGEVRKGVGEGKKKLSQAVLVHPSGRDARRKTLGNAPFRLIGKMTLEVDLNNRAPAALLKSTVERASAVSA
jgi:hypothetical protein